MAKIQHGVKPDIFKDAPVLPPRLRRPTHREPSPNGQLRLADVTSSGSGPGEYSLATRLAVGFCTSCALWFVFFAS